MGKINTLSFALLLRAGGLGPPVQAAIKAGKPFHGVTEFRFRMEPR